MVAIRGDLGIGDEFKSECVDQFQRLGGSGRDGDGERQSQDEDRAFHLGVFPGGLIDVDEVFREMSFSMA